MTHAAADTGPSGLRRFWRWWTFELSQTFGGGRRPSSPPRRRVQIANGDAIVSHANGKEIERIVLLPDTQGDIKTPKRIALVLPSEATLVRSVEVPRRAEANLSQVVDFEFEAHIPLRREACYIAYRVADRRADKITVDIVAVPRERVDADRRTLSDVGLSPSWVMARGIPLNLLDDGLDAPQRGRDMVLFAIWFLIIISLIAAAWYPAWRLQEHNRVLQVQADATMARANQALALQSDVDTAEDQLTRLDAIARPTWLLQHLEILADILPDDVVVTRLNFDGENITITVIAPQAAEVMEKIAGLSTLGSPELTTAVSRTPDGRERATLNVPLLEGGVP